jgi:hypothetical protein
MVSADTATDPQPVMGANTGIYHNYLSLQQYQLTILA